MLLVRLAILALLASGTFAREPGPVPRELHFDRNGYPLPPGAIARLGIPPALPGLSCSLAWTADGKQIIASDGNGVIIFDSTSGRWVETIPAAGERTTSNLTFRHGHAVLKLQGSEGTLFDPLTGENIVAFKFPPPLGDPGRKLYSLDLSANHRFLAGIASADSSPGVAWRFDLASNRYTRLINDRADLQSLRLSPDAKRVFATGGTADPVLTARDIANGKELWTVPLKGAGRLRAVSADGRRLAVTDYAGLTVFDAANGKTVMNTPLDSAILPGMYSVDLSPDGSRVALADGQVVTVWHTGSGKVEHRLAYEARLVAFSPDGKSLLTGSAWIQKWDMQTGKPAFAESIMARPWGATRLKWSEDGNRLLTVWPVNKLELRVYLLREFLGVWHVANEELVWKEKFESAVQAAQLDWHGTRVRAFMHDRLVRSWNTSQPENPIVAQAYAPPIANENSFQEFLPGGRLAIQSHNFQGATLEMYDPQGKYEFRRTRKWPDVGPRRAESHFRGRGTVLYGPAGWRYDFLINSEIPPLQGSIDARLISLLPVQSTTFVAGRTIAGSTISSYLWESLTGGIATNLPQDIPNFDKATLSPDGQHLAVAAEREVIVHNLRNSAWNWSVPVASASALAFSPDGSILATAATDSTVLLWKTPKTAHEWKQPDSDDLWNNLSSIDASVAWKSLWHLQDYPAQAAELLATHMQPVPGPKDTASWILKLDHAKFNVREEAAKTLAGWGESIEGDLREALKSPRSEEQRSRLEQILLKLNPAVPPIGEALRGLRCVWLLERIGTPEAWKLLERMAGGASGSRVTVEAKLAILRLNATQ